jgi:hypothetical protein
MKLNDTFIGLIRTWVPIGVGAFIAWLATNGLELDKETQAAAIVASTGAIQAIYYTIVRLLENKIPAVGWLLGSAKTPTYTPAEPQVVYVEVPAAKTAVKKTVKKTAAKK